MSAPLQPVRPCVACGQHDDHPRCQVVLRDGSSMFYHHDCHAMVEPPCGACQWLTAHKGELTGDEWREQIHSVHAALSPEQRDLHPHERDVVESHRDGNRV